MKKKSKKPKLSLKSKKKRFLNNGKNKENKSISSKLKTQSIELRQKLPGKTNSKE